MNRIRSGLLTALEEHAEWLRAHHDLARPADAAVYPATGPGIVQNINANQDGNTTDGKQRRPEAMVQTGANYENKY